MPYSWFRPQNETEQLTMPLAVRGRKDQRKRQWQQRMGTSDPSLSLWEQLRRLQLPLVLLTVCLTSEVATASTSVQCARTLDEELPSGRAIVDLNDLLVQQGHRLPEDVETDFQIFNAQPPNSERYFKVNQRSGMVTVGQRLDRDRLCAEVNACCDRSTSCRLTLQVQSDKEFTFVVTLSITINDLNDNSPRWSSLEVTREFSEAAQPGEFRALPLADDADSARYGVQRYEILPPRPPEFELDYDSTASAMSAAAVALSSSSFSGLSGMTGSNTGAVPALRLVLKRPLDRETRDSYQFVVAAFDGGNPALNGSVRVRVLVADENDEHPVFERSQYSVTVKEDLAMGREILQVKAHDKDAGLNGKVAYSIPAFAPVRIRSLFSIDPATGVIRLAGKLDYESAKELQFTVVAQDNSRVAPRQGTTQVVVKLIDVNDERPRISMNADPVSVSENERPGKTVTIVTVADRDSGINGEVNCQLKDSRDMFALELLNPRDTREAGDSVLYKLVTTRTLDREADGIYNRPIAVTIYCADRGEPTNTVERPLQVDIRDQNDHPPVFALSNFHFTVNERTRVGSEVFVLSATDKDTGRNALLAYELNGTSTFIVNSDGRVSLKEKLDRETQDRHEFVAIARDHGEPSMMGTANVIVMVEDDNDHHPVMQSYFAFRIPENATMGQLVGILNATDDDEGHNARLHFSLASTSSSVAAVSRVFRIHPDGRVTLAGRLDREVVSRYEFTVLVRDSAVPPSTARSASATVLIEVEDINDCRPRFTFPTAGNRTLVVSTGAQVGVELGKVTAFDADAEGNGRLHFFIRPATQGEKDTFHMDPDSGTVSLVRQLTREMLTRPPILTVTVRDGGHPPLEDSQSLLIVFQDQAQMAGAGRAHSEVFGSGVGSGSGGGGGGAVGSPGEAAAQPDNLLVIVGLIAVTATFVLLLLVGAIVLSCRRRLEGFPGERGRRQNRGRQEVEQGRKFLAAADGGGTGRQMASGATVGAAAQYYQESGGSGPQKLLLLRSQQQVSGGSCSAPTVSATSGPYRIQGDGLAPEFSSSLHSLSNDDAQSSNNEGDSGRGGSSDLMAMAAANQLAGSNTIGKASHRETLQQHSANNYESLMQRSRFAADGAETSGGVSGQHHQQQHHQQQQEYYRLHYTTVQHHHQHQQQQQHHRQAAGADGSLDGGPPGFKPAPPVINASYV